MQWIDFLGKYYKEQKAKNSEYKYKDAMIDAVKPYRAQSTDAPAKKRKGSTKKRNGKRKGGRTERRRK